MISRTALRWGAGSWLVLRLLTFASAWGWASRLPLDTLVQAPGYRPPPLGPVAEFLAGPWLRSDALWYLKISSQGYGPEPGTYAFYPLFPTLVRWLNPVFGGNEVLAGLFVANVAAIIGLVVLFALVERLADATAAKTAVVGLALFPTAFFLVAPYGEPLLIAAGAGALLAAVEGRFLTGGVAGALAALSRPFGILLVFPLAGIAAGKGRRAWPLVAGPVLAWLGWLGWVGMRTGDFLQGVRVQSLWQRGSRFPPATLAEGVIAVDRWWGTPFAPYVLLDLVSTLAGIGMVAGGVIVLRRARAAPAVVAGLALYGGLVLLVPLSVPFWPRPLLSIPRFVLALFPLFVGVGVAPKRVRIPLAVLSGTALAWATAMFVAGRPIF